MVLTGSQEIARKLGLKKNCVQRFVRLTEDTFFCLFYVLSVYSFFNSRCPPLNGCYLGSFLLINSLYLLITFFVLRKSPFSRLTRDLPYSLFQLNRFKIFYRIELRNIVNTVNGKRAKLKETDKARSLINSLLGYQSSFASLLADISIKP